MNDVRNGDAGSSQATDAAPVAEAPTAQALSPAGTPVQDGTTAAAQAAMVRNEEAAPVERALADGAAGDDEALALARRRVRRTARTEIEAAALGNQAEPASEPTGDELSFPGRGGLRVNVLGDESAPEQGEGGDGARRARRPRDRRQTGARRPGDPAAVAGPDGPVTDGSRRPDGGRRHEDQGAGRPRRERPAADGPRRPSGVDGGRAHGSPRPDRGEPGPRRPFDRPRPGADARGERAPRGFDRGGPRRPDAPPGTPGRPGPRLGGPSPDRRPGHPAPVAAATARAVATPAPTASASKSEDKVTLILHPAPKMAPGRFKPADRPLTAKEALRAKAAKRVAQKGGRPNAPAGDEPIEATAPTAELLETWIEADGDNALAVLSAAGPHADQVILAWQEHASVEALLAIASIDAAAPEGQGPISGALRKAARRAINVLRSRGVAIPEPVGQKASAAPIAGDGVAETPTATFVPPDGTGTVFFSVSQRQAGGRYRVADAVVRDVLGIVHASSGRLAGKQLRRWRDRVESRIGAAPVDVPVQWARWRIAEARRRNASSGQVLPLGLDGCAPLFEPVPDVEPRHPLADLEAGVTDAQAAAATADSGKLHGEPELRSWMADRTAVEAMLRQVGTRVGARGASDQELVNRTLEEEIAAATDRYFTPEARALLSQRLRDTAISVHARAGDEAAAGLLALAKAIREAGLITSPPRDIPFLTAFFRKAIGVLASQGGGRLNIPVPAAPPATVSAPQEPPAEVGPPAPEPPAQEGG